MYNLISFLSDLKSSVDLRLLVERHDATLVSTALTVGKTLQPLRKLLAAYVQTHRGVIFATGNASRSADWEMQIVRLLEGLRPCRFFSELFTSIEKDLVWIDRLDPSIVLVKKA